VFIFEFKKLDSEIKITHKSKQISSKSAGIVENQEEYSTKTHFFELGIFFLR
jgi:hypothetical protein